MLNLVARICSPQWPESVRHSDQNLFARICSPLVARIWSTESVRHMWRPDSVLLDENLVATYGTQSVRLRTEYCHIWLESGLIWTDSCQYMVSVGTRLSPNRPIVPICKTEHGSRILSRSPPEAGIKNVWKSDKSLEPEKMWKFDNLKFKFKI